MTYSEMARFRDALQGEPKDRVPIIPMISAWAAMNFSEQPLSRLAFDPDAIIRANIRARDAMGYDAFFAYTETSPVAEAFGCRVSFRETSAVTAPITNPINSFEDVDDLVIPKPRKDGRLPLVLELVEGLSHYGGGDIPILGGLSGPFTTTCNIFEIGRVLRMVYKNPRVLESLLDKMTAFLVDYGSALTERGANVIFIPEPSASASMISPATFHRFVLPRLKTLISHLKVPCILHICGDTSTLMAPMSESGADILSLDQCMNLSEAREKARDVVLAGNVDPVEALLMGNEEEVRRDTLRSLESGGTHRFILMTGCGVPAATKRENMAAMITTTKTYGLGG